MKKSLLSRGFTLIELLVVIAIIGILAAVVIGSLNDARSGGQNASIKQSVSNVRTQAEIYYNSKSYTYNVSATDNVCVDTRITSLISAALQVIGSTAAIGTGAPNATTAVCRSTAAGYMVMAPLVTPTGTQQYWCVDNTGVSRQVTTATASGIVCPAT